MLKANNSFLVPAFRRCGLFISGISVGWKHTGREGGDDERFSPTSWLSSSASCWLGDFHLVVSSSTFSCFLHNTHIEYIQCCLLLFLLFSTQPSIVISIYSLSVLTCVWQYTDTFSSRQEIEGQMRNPVISVSV